jgi:hypothetical protein
MMTQFLGVASLITAFLGGIAMIIRAVYIGRAWVIWADRCDPKNTNFRPPLIDRRKP